MDEDSRDAAGCTPICTARSDAATPPIGTTGEEAVADGGLDPEWDAITGALLDGGD